jgi:hypothetical protein
MLSRPGMGVPGFNAERGAVVEKYVFVEVVIDALVEVGEGCRISELLTGWRRRLRRTTTLVEKIMI